MPYTAFEPDAFQSNFIQEFAAQPILGWEPVLPLLQTVNKLRAGYSALRQRPGFAAFPFPFPEGWQVQPPQPPFYPTTKQQITGALSQKTEGIEYPFQRFFRSGWEPNLPQPLKQPPVVNQKAAAVLRGDDGTEGIYIKFFPSGWEIQPYQPPFYLKTNQKSAALSQWEDGIEGVFVPPVVAVTTNWAYDAPLISPRKIFLGLDQYGNVDSQFVRFFPSGWEFQASHLLPRYNPAAKTVPNSGDDGIEYPFINFIPYGWEIQPYQSPHQFFEKRGSTLRGDDGTEGIYINFKPYGWELQPPQPPFRISQNRGTILKGIDGIEYQYINFIPYGWEVLPYQPPFYPKTNQKPGAWSQWEDGIEGILINFFPSGWEIQPPQPPFYPKTNQKIGSLSQWEDGIEAVYVFVSPIKINWSEFQQPPLKINYRASAWSQWEDGVEYPFTRFFPSGWEIQPPPPPHVFVEKRGLFLRGDDGIEYPFVRFFPSGWEIQPPQPPFWLKTNLKYGSLSHPEEGIEGVYIFVPPPPIFWAWEIIPVQPPHPRPEKSGSWMFGDLGIEGIYKFVAPTIRNFEFLIRWRRRGRR